MAIKKTFQLAAKAAAAEAERLLLEEPDEIAPDGICVGWRQTANCDPGESSSLLAAVAAASRKQNSSPPWWCSLYLAPSVRPLRARTSVTSLFLTLPTPRRDADGAREKAFDKICSQPVPEGQSGYCLCANNIRIKYDCTHLGVVCEEECFEAMEVGALEREGLAPLSEEEREAAREMAELGRADAQFEHEICVGWTETAGALLALVARSCVAPAAVSILPLRAKRLLRVLYCARAHHRAVLLFDCVSLLRLRCQRSAGDEARSWVQPYCARRAQRVVRLRL